VLKAASLLVGAFFLLSATENTACAKDQSADHFELQDLLPLSLQKNPRVQLAVITEFTAEGKKATPATPQNPVYYVASDKGLTTSGDGIAGEKSPPLKRLADALEKALATNGYLPADKTHPPTLLISYRWGSFNHLETSLNLPTDVPSTEKLGGLAQVQVNDISPMDERQQQNLVERAAIVGGTQFSFEVRRALHDGHLKEFRLRDVPTSQLMDQAEQDLYYIIASAYDYHAVQEGEEKLLWCTKISTASQGMEMDTTLPQLLTNAAPYFGREMDKAEPFRVRIYKGKVEMGAPKVEGYIAAPGK